MFRALGYAITAAVPCCAVTYFTDNFYVLALTGYLPSALLFFIVLLVEFHGMEPDSAFGLVLSTYWGLAIRNIPIVGTAVELSDTMTRDRVTPSGPSPTPEEERRTSRALWIGGSVGAVIAAIVSYLLLAETEKSVVERVYYSIFFGLNGAMWGMIFGVAITESVVSPQSRRLIATHVMYGVFFGALMGGTLFTSFPFGAGLMLAYWTFFGAVAGVFGDYYRRAMAADDK